METPVNVTTNHALTWFDETELRQLKKDVAENLVDKLKSICKPTLIPHEAAQYQNILDPVTNKKTNSLLWVRRYVYELQVKEIIEHYRRLGKRIDGRLYHFHHPEGNKEGVTDTQIERAKEYPIQELFTELVGTPIRGGMAKCPFHPDKTASMSLRKNNRFHCFGCNEKGDSIAFCMKIQNIPFVSAVEKLSTGA